MAQTLTVELADRSYPIHFSDSRSALHATVADLRAAKRSVRVIADAGLMAAQPDFLAVAYDAYEAAVSRGRDIVILDTAGRLHTKNNLMKELEKFQRVIKKQDETAPHHSWLVVDGSLGSNSIEQARVFNQSFPLTGLIITKLDGTSRGGALVGIYRELKLPIYFVGLGEQPDDLQPFSAQNYANAIFGITDDVAS